MCQAFASILFYSMPSILQQEDVYFIVCLTGYSPLHQQGFVGCSLHFREQYSHIIPTRIHNTVYIDHFVRFQAIEGKVIFEHNESVSTIHAIIEFQLCSRLRKHCKVILNLTLHSLDP